MNGSWLPAQVFIYRDTSTAYSAATGTCGCRHGDLPRAVYDEIIQTRSVRDTANSHSLCRIAPSSSRVDGYR